MAHAHVQQSIASRSLQNPNASTACLHSMQQSVCIAAGRKYKPAARVINANSGLRVRSNHQHPGSLLIPSTSAAAASSSARQLHLASKNAATDSRQATAQCARVASSALVVTPPVTPHECVHWTQSRFRVLILVAMNSPRAPEPTEGLQLSWTRTRRLVVHSALPATVLVSGERGERKGR